MPRNAPHQSLQRAVQILYAVAAGKDGRTVPQIAADLRLKANTLGRYVRSMESEKLLARREHPLRFVLGPAIADLKHIEDSRQLLDVAGPILVRTQAGLPTANFSLVEMDGGDTYTRLKVEEDQVAHLQLERLWNHTAYFKASSLLFLAYASPRERERYYKMHPFTVQGAPLWGTKEKLQTFLSDTVRFGYALPDFPDSQYHRLAAPVFAPDGRMIAAVGAYVNLKENERTRRRLKKLAIEAAKAISAGLRGKNEERTSDGAQDLIR